MRRMKKGRLNKQYNLLYLIGRTLQEEGVIRFDFGKFELIKRKGTMIKKITGKSQGHWDESKPYYFISFRANRKLKNILKVNV